MWNQYIYFQGRKRHLLGKTEVAWKSTGKAKKKWTVAIIESRSYNFGESGEREAWNIIGSSQRKSKPRSLRWHWVFTLAIFYLPWGLCWPDAPWPSSQHSRGKTICVPTEKEAIIARLLGRERPPPEGSAPFPCIRRRDEAMGPLWRDFSLESASLQSWLPCSLKVRVSIPMRSGAIKTKLQLVLSQT